MAGMDARELALEALLDRQGMVTQRLDRLVAERSPSPADAGLAMELAYGVRRRQRTLDAVARAFSRQPNRKGPQAVDEILRLGLYQLLLLQRVPDFAAVSEAVSACQRRNPRRAGFVNAVLRNVIRQMEPAQDGPFPVTGDAIAITPDNYVPLRRQVLRSAEQNVVQFLGESCSLPDDLAQRWLARYGSLERAFFQG